MEREGGRKSNFFCDLALQLCIAITNLHINKIQIAHVRFFFFSWKKNIKICENMLANVGMQNTI
jgi:hypothetical protein